MNAENLEALSRLCLCLSQLYDVENRPAGNAASQALKEASTSVPDIKEHPAPPLETGLISALSHDPLPLADLILAAMPCLTWLHSSIDGRIREDVAQGLMTNVLIGEGGLFASKTVKLGLFYQGPGIDYTTRTHSAEETFIMIAGRGVWQSGGAGPHELGKSAIIHHPSYMPHASVTQDHAFVAAWRWSGNISKETYVMK